MSMNASALCARGTKSSRLTTASSSSTSSSKTFHGRICCSIMLKRACSKFIGYSWGYVRDVNRICKMLPGADFAGAVISAPAAPQQLRQIIHVAIHHRHHDQSQQRQGDHAANNSLAHRGALFGAFGQSQ